MNNKERLYQWLKDKGISEFFDAMEIAEKADEIFNPESYSSKIAKVSITEQELHFHGPDITEEENKKMSAAMLRVFSLMKDGQWRTLENLMNVIGSPTQSIAIYLRAFREKRYGGHIVNKRKVGKGRIFEYQLIIR